MEEQKQQIEAIRDYWNQRANGFALAVDEELNLEEAKEWERQFRESIQKPEARVLDDGTLFECVAASEPTSWLSTYLHIVFHLT